MGITPYENLKGFAHTRPPIMVFMICLGLFAIVLMSLAYYVKISEVSNPDVSKDWNLFLKSFSELEFCVQGNSSDFLTTATTPSPVGVGKSVTTTLSPHGVKTRDVTTENTQLDTETLRNYSVSMLLTVIPTVDFLRIPHNLTYLSASFEGSLLGLIGPAGDEMINVTMQLPFEWNTTHCAATGGRCPEIKIFTCVHFTAAASVFPPTKSPVCEMMNDTGIEYHAYMLPLKPKAYAPYYCRQRPLVKVKHDLDPKLTVWLSLHDRSVINLHLMHTSYFLFVMVVTLLCYAIIRGRPLKTKLTQTESHVSLTA